MIDHSRCFVKAGVRKRKPAKGYERSIRYSFQRPETSAPTGRVGVSEDHPGSTHQQPQAYCQHADHEQGICGKWRLQGGTPAEWQGRSADEWTQLATALGTVSGNSLCGVGDAYNAGVQGAEKKRASIKRDCYRHPPLPGGGVRVAADRAQWCMRGRHPAGRILYQP